MFGKLLTIGAVISTVTICVLTHKYNLEKMDKLTELDACPDLFGVRVGEDADKSI